MRRFRWSTVAFVLILVALVLPGAAWAQGGTLDQANDVPAQSYVGEVEFEIQTFTAGRDGILDRIELKGFRRATTGQVTIVITPVDQNGATTGVVLGSGSFDTSTLPEFSGDMNAGDWVSVPISPGVQVQAGVQYAIIKTTRSPSLFLWSLSINDTYTGGAGSGYPVGQPYDHLFRTYVLSASTAPSCNGLEATIYVQNGVIVGGPDNGKTYAGKFKGSKGNDVIVGTEGNDKVEGGNGNDTICGLGGNDSLKGNNGNDVIDGGSGNDKVDGGNDDDQLIGGDGDDSVEGNDGNDTLNGGNGKDRLEGGKGNDTLTGGAGPDKFSGGPGTDTTPDFNAAEGDKRTNVP